MTQLTDIDAALAWLLTRATPLAETEPCALLRARGRILAAPVVATLDVPPHDNSAMDGYAVRSSECTDVALPVSQRIPAGSQPAPLEPGTVARIFTGAPVPAGCDAVVMQEETLQEEDGRVRFTRPVRAGQNIRCAGEDIAAGAVILPAGSPLSASDLGLAASIGQATVEVVRPLRVAVFFTGDELVEPGQALGAAQIYNSNRYWLVPALEALGCTVCDLGIVPDTLEATRAALRQAAGSCDVIMTCGGVSVGEEDHVRSAVEAEGRLDLWKLAIKPGKPFACGSVGSADFIGLPGNPVSGFVTFATLVRPFLLRRAGLAEDRLRPRVMRLPVGFDWLRPDPKRTEYLRVRIVTGETGQRLEKFPHQGSGVLASCAWAHGLARVAPGQVLAAGDLIEFMPFPEGI